MFKGITRWKNYIFVISGMCNIVENVKITHFKKYLHVHCHHSSGCLSIKKNPITMKIDTPEFHSVFTPELNSLAKLFEKYGYELRIVGGAVRDLLSGQSPHDLDFATTATPDQMKEMFEKEGVRMLNTKGEKHGTITPRINDKANFEVTTLRTDVKTDGRHAEVEFTKSWELDAMRRDLTVNSMYLGFDGKVYDYFGGYEDLRNRRVIFVGNASQRIQEDYLRILRYFRFYGRIAKNAHSHDEETLKAIQENASGLQKISGERIWSELQRIVTGNFAEELVKKMLDLGLSTHIGLGPVEDLDIKSFENTYRLKEKYAFRSITYIAALLPNEERVLQFHSRVKLSAHERDLAIFINNFKSDNLAEPIENPLRPFQFLLITTKMKRPQIREFILELFRFKDREDLLTTFESWKIPSFPVNGEKLKEKGMSRGNDIGFALNQMKVFWAESDFTLSENELMEKLPEILAQIQNRTGKK